MKCTFQPLIDRLGYKSKADFAKSIGKSQSAISVWESGEHGPTYEMCGELLKLGMTIRELFGDEVADAMFMKQTVSEPGIDNKNEIENIVNNVVSETFKKMMSGLK